MSRYIVLHESGASEFLLIDKETQKVTTLRQEELTTGDVKVDSGENRFKGLDMAVVLIPHPDVVTRMLYRQDKVAA